MKTRLYRLISRVCSVCLLAILLAGCSGIPGATGAASQAANYTVAQTSTAVATPLPTPAPTLKPVLRVLSASIISDPPVLPDSVDDPYAEMNPNLIESMNPDREQYNTLYRAVEAMEPKLDVSSFKMSRIRMNNMISYLDTNFRLFYLKNFKVSKNGKTATFTYSGTKEEIGREREAYMARLGHLVYDMAPEGYTDLQKFISVYESICEMSNYSATMNDTSTWSPYSIVMKGQGICWGYAMLTEFVLKRAGIPVRYVCNESHAWNVVNIGGKWYQTDVTWGAGNSGDTVNNLRTLLMDDAARVRSIENAGYKAGEIIEGYNRADASSPPACTDASFSDYENVGYAYAFDIDDNRIYFSGGDGIARMNLDGTGMETLAQGIYTYGMVFFNGYLYYVDQNDGFLYRLKPGDAPEPLETAASVTNLRLVGTVLSYDTVSGGATVVQSIPLLPLPSGLATDVETMPGAEAMRDRSFRFDIQFSMPVDANQNWNESIYLADATGRTIPLHFAWSADGTTLTVRPKLCLADAGRVTLYVSSGIEPVVGAEMEKPCRMDVKIKAGE